MKIRQDFVTNSSSSSFILSWSKQYPVPFGINTVEELDKRVTELFDEVNVNDGSYRLARKKIMDGCTLLIINVEQGNEESMEDVAKQMHAELVGVWN